MAINNTRDLGASYDTLRLALFRQWEGHHGELIFDTANPPHPTIGIGFNLDDLGVRTRVFDEMEVTFATHRTALEAILQSPTIRALPQGTAPGEHEYEMQQALDAYLTANPGAANKATFTLTDSEMNNVFELEADDPAASG